MVKQVQLNLNVPLDVDAQATLSQTKLLPQFATASAILHGDYYTQQQSKLNRYILRHYATKTLFIVTVGTTLIYKVWDYIMVSTSVYEFLQYSITKDFIFEVIGSFPSLMAVAGMIAVLIYFISDDLKDVSKKLIVDNYIGDIFGFNIVEFAKLDKDDKTLSATSLKLLENGDNTHLLIYRNSPIAIVTIVPNFENDRYIVKISGLHVRKVFAKVDFEEMLLEWSILRARKVLQDYLNSKKINLSNQTLEIQIDCYSWDKKFSNLLNHYEFIKIDETCKLNPFAFSEVPAWQSTISDIFNIKKVTYELTIVTDKDDEKILSENPAVAESIESKNENKENDSKSIRKRK